MSTPPATPALRVGFVAGVTLTKWTTIWRERFRSVPLEVIEIAERDQRRALADNRVDLCFVRMPIDADGLHVIPLYEEVPVVWVSKEHAIAALDEIVLRDLDGETVLSDVDASTIDQVAVGVAVIRAPMSVVRSHSRRDLTYRPIVDAQPTRIGLAWLVDAPHPLTDEFIGVVRGRTVNSSRTQQERGARRPQKPDRKGRQRG